MGRSSDGGTTVQRCFIDLDEPWALIGVLRGVDQRWMTRYYCADTSGRRCILICSTRLRAGDLIGRAAELTVEMDTGVPVVTIWRRCLAATGVLPSLSQHLWPG